MKSLIGGVTISVAQKGQSASIEIEADGYLGEIMGECVLSLRATVAPEKKRDIFGISVDGKKNVVLKKDINNYLNIDDFDGPAIFQAGIQVKSNGEVFHTEYPNNHLRLLVLGDNGNIQIWEIAIISQDGKFFVTEQKTWDTYCYNDDGRFACPLFEGLKGWPQLVAVLGKLFAGNLGELPPLSEKKKEDPNRNDAKVFAENRGIVVWYNQAQMLGVIKTSMGAARAYWKDIERNGSRMPHLKPGEMVSYTGLVPPRLTKGRGTSLQFDAIGIRPMGY